MMLEFYQQSNYDFIIFHLIFLCLYKTVRTKLNHHTHDPTALWLAFSWCCPWPCETTSASVPTLTRGWPGGQWGVEPMYVRGHQSTAMVLPYPALYFSGQSWGQSGQWAMLLHLLSLVSGEHGQHAGHPTTQLTVHKHRDISTTVRPGKMFKKRKLLNF